MSLPYKIATLLYCFNRADEVLLLERAQEPNRGFWSPCGGKLKMDIGESPYACACREAAEEIGARLTATDLHLTWSHQRARLPGPDRIDSAIPVRGEAAVKITSARPRRGAASNFSTANKYQG